MVVGKVSEVVVEVMPRGQDLQPPAGLSDSLNRGPRNQPLQYRDKQLQSTYRRRERSSHSLPWNRIVDICHVKRPERQREFLPWRGTIDTLSRLLPICNRNTIMGGNSTQSAARGEKAYRRSSMRVKRSRPAKRRIERVLSAMPCGMIIGAMVCGVGHLVNGCFSATPPRGRQTASDHQTKRAVRSTCDSKA